MTETDSFLRSAADFFANFLGDTSYKEALEDGRCFKYNPQPDITTYELSLCIYIVIAQLSNNTPLRNVQKIYDLLPPSVQRHFTVLQMEGDGQLQGDFEKS